MAFCMEGRRLFPFMTVLENLQMGAYRRGKARRTAWSGSSSCSPT